jgi:hypothetical protein
MKKYVLEVIVNEQSDEFFEEITEDGRSGCDEVLDAIKSELIAYDVEVRLTKFEDK